jgi:hypothetical protein
MTLNYGIHIIHIATAWFNINFDSQNILAFWGIFCAAPNS